MKKAMSLFLTATVIMAVCGCNAVADDAIKIVVDGETIKCEAAPYISDEERTMVPLRAIFEALDTKVDWNDETKTVTGKNENKNVTLKIGENIIRVNGAEKELESASCVVNDYTMVPARAVAEALGAEVSWDQATKTVTVESRHVDDKTEDDGDTSWKNNTGTINLDASEVTGNGISIADDKIEITEGGIFTVSGTGAKQIYIDCNDRIKLILDNCNIKNKNGSAIYIKNAKKVFVELLGDSKNYLEDGANPEDEKAKGVLYSKDDLDIYGEGELVVKSNYDHGIVSKETLEIKSGTVNVTSVGDGIHADDGIDITGGTVTVNAGEDGIQSEYYLNVSGGDINITTTGTVEEETSEFMPRGDIYSSIAKKAGFDDNSDEFKSMKVKAVLELLNTDESKQNTSVSSKGLKSDSAMNISGGNIIINSTDHAVHSTEDMKITSGKMTLNSQSGKGISAHGYLNIDGSDIKVEKSTEGIESKSVMTINDGQIDITASEDGLNTGGGTQMGKNPTDTETMLKNMLERAVAEDTDITMGELMEKDNPMQNGGFGGGRGMRNPDMQNAYGERPQMPPRGTPLEIPQPPEGGMPPEMPKRPEGNIPPQMGKGRFGERNEYHNLNINGGTITINANGDGIDSNGDLNIKGGYVAVNGPASGGNSALDCGDGGYSINIDKGTVIAVGSLGMVTSPSGESKQNVLNVAFSEKLTSGTAVTVKDSEGNEILSFTPVKDYQSLIFSSDKIKTGKTYIVSAGSEELSCEVSETITRIGGR